MKQDRDQNRQLRLPNILTCGVGKAGRDIEVFSTREVGLNPLATCRGRCSLPENR